MDTAGHRYLPMGFLKEKNADKHHSFSVHRSLMCRSGKKAFRYIVNAKRFFNMRKCIAVAVIG